MDQRPNKTTGTKIPGMIAATAILAHEDGALTCSASAHEHGQAGSVAGFTTKVNAAVNIL